MKRMIIGFAAGVAVSIIFLSACNAFTPQDIDAGEVFTVAQAVSSTDAPSATATPTPPPVASAAQDAAVRQIASTMETVNVRLAEVAAIASATPTSTPTATPIPTPTPTPKTVSTASPAPVQKVEAAAVIGAAGSTSTDAASNTADAQATEAAVTAATGVYTALSDEYISEVMRGINDSRAKEGNPAVTLDSSFCELAAAHAKKMAEAGRMYHSDYKMIESVGKGTTGGMVAYNTGAFSAYHAPQIARDAEVTRVGIGGWIKDGEIYVCIVAE